MDFYPLQVTSVYQFLDSALRPEEYVLGLDKNCYPGAAVCDRNQLRAFASYSSLFSRHQKKLICGLAVDVLIDGFSYELLLYIEGEKGYRSVVRMMNMGKTSYLLEDLAGLEEVAAVLKTNNSGFYLDSIENQHGRTIFSLFKLFPHFYLGIEMYSSEEQELVSAVRDYAARFGLKTIAIPKVLYLNRASERRYLMLQSLKEKKKLEKSTSDSAPYFLLGADALKTIYTEEEISSTAELADKCHFDIFAKRGELPRFSPDSPALLRAKATAGLQTMQGGPEYRERLEHELKIIEDMGFSDYFLIVADYVDFARQHDIKVGPGRGSAASSLVSYLLMITEVDPLRYQLIFERFLNPDRITMPDIDIDFEDTRRDEVVDYLKKTYGGERAAAIVTYTSLQAAGALNAIGEIRGIAPERIKRLTSNLLPGKSLAESFQKSYTIKDICRDPYYHEIYDEAREIEGFLINSSKHAAGVILSDTDLSTLLPFDGGVVGYEYEHLEKMGFLKLDILSLTNLGFIRQVEDNIKKTGAIIPLLEDRLDDPAVYRTLNHLLTYGVFQLESDGMRKAIVETAPGCFADLVALLALYRPGPMSNIAIFAANKKNPANLTYQDPVLERILGETYSVILYQEQIIRIITDYAGLSMAKADSFRRAISKKDETQMALYRQDFISGAARMGHEKSEAEKIYSLIERFSNYGFNKAHSVSYALISFRLLAYKTYFPEAFYRAALQKSGFNTSDVKILQRELTALGYQLQRPLIGRSGAELLLQEHVAVLPLTLVKGLGADCVAKAGTTRSFLSLGDCFLKLGAHQISALEYRKMIDAGLFDELEPNRAKIRKNLGRLIDYGQFGDPENAVVLEDETPRPREDYYLESQALGCSLSRCLKDLAPRDLLADGLSLYLLIAARSQSETEYDAICDEGNMILSFGEGHSFAPFALVAIKGRLSRNRKRVYVDLLKEER